MNICISRTKNLHGTSLKLVLRRSVRILGNPRSVHVKNLGTIRVSNLSDAAIVENFLQNVTQKLFAQELSTGKIHNLLRSLCRREPAFLKFFENLKF